MENMNINKKLYENVNYYVNANELDAGVDSQLESSSSTDQDSLEYRNELISMQRRIYSNNRSIMMRSATSAACLFYSKINNYHHHNQSSRTTAAATLNVDTNFDHYHNQEASYESVAHYNYSLSPMIDAEIIHDTMNHQRHEHQNQTTNKQQQQPSAGKQATKTPGGHLKMQLQKLFTKNIKKIHQALTTNKTSTNNPVVKNIQAAAATPAVAAIDEHHDAVAFKTPSRRSMTNKLMSTLKSSSKINKRKSWVIDNNRTNFNNDNSQMSFEEKKSCKAKLVYFNYKNNSFLASLEQQQQQQQQQQQEKEEEENRRRKLSSVINNKNNKKPIYNCSTNYNINNNYNYNQYSASKRRPTRSINSGSSINSFENTKLCKKMRTYLNSKDELKQHSSEMSIINSTVKNAHRSIVAKRERKLCDVSQIKRSESLLKPAALPIYSDFESLTSKYELFPQSSSSKIASKRQLNMNNNINTKSNQTTFLNPNDILFVDFHSNNSNITTSTPLMSRRRSTKSSTVAATATKMSSSPQYDSCLCSSAGCYSSLQDLNQNNNQTNTINKQQLNPMDQSTQILTDELVLVESTFNSSSISNLSDDLIILQTATTASVAPRTPRKSSQQKNRNITGLIASSTLKFQHVNVNANQRARKSFKNMSFKKATDKSSSLAAASKDWNFLVINKFSEDTNCSLENIPEWALGNNLNVALVNQAYYNPNGRGVFIH